jgi:hypothetical protein
MDREKLKLQQEQLKHEQNQQAFEASKGLNPDAAAKILSSILGQAIQPGDITVPPAQQEADRLTGYLNANPDVATAHNNLLAMGSLFGPAEATDAARVASGLRLSAGQRAERVGQLLDHYGSPAAPAWNAAVGRELGVRAPSGPTLAEKGLKLQERQVDLGGKEAEAARVRAHQSAIEAISGGFQPLPNSPAAKDPALASKYVSELVQFGLGNSDVVSPEALTQMVPTEKWAQIFKASATPSPQLQLKMDMWKHLAGVAEKQGDKMDPELLKMLQQYTVEIDQELHPDQGGVAPQEAPAGAGPSRVGSLLKSGAMTFGGRPGMSVEPLVTALLGHAPAPEFLQALGITSPNKAIQGSIDKAVGQLGPELLSPRKSLGPLSDPALFDSGVATGTGPKAGQFNDNILRGQLPKDSLEKLKGIVGAYQKAGASADDAAKMEQDLVDALKSGDPAIFDEMVTAAVEDVQAQKAASK